MFLYYCYNVQYKEGSYFVFIVNKDYLYSVYSPYTVIV